MGFILGVNLLPSSGEFVYDTQPYQAKRVTEQAFTGFNRFYGAAGTKTDFSWAIDQLQVEHPGCKTVALIVAWFGDSLDASACRIYPTTTYIGGAFQKLAAGVWTTDHWRCSGLTEASGGLIPISLDAQGAFHYGGTPSDQSVVRAIEDLKARGFRVVFYPFVLMDAPGLPWRGRITFGTELTAATTSAVAHFLGSATPAQFARDAPNMAVSYSGSPTDYSYRRMILHYANLCVVAGGVDLFLLGSEFRGIETLRGPAWTPAGVAGGDGRATWDYPFVNGLIQLSDDVRGIFDAAGYAKDLAGLHNLVTYSADWSVWMGYQHPGANGQWPHLDQLWGHANIDLVSFDNYLPLSDWTTGSGGLDAAHWADAAPDPAAWPPSPAAMNGLGLTGTPTINSLAYLKANIEGGEKFNWFYNDTNNLGRGADPNGGALPVSLPEGDRLMQSRNPYFPGQQPLANKMLRWWWNNSHQAIYDAGDGLGWAPHGPPTKWTAQSKPLTFAEYGFSSVDRATNQPNLTFDPRSVENATPFWSEWSTADGVNYAPVENDRLMFLALRAVYEYWLLDDKNETSAAGVRMIEPAFMSAWNWDARPYPVFPNANPVFPYIANAWGDVGDWAAGKWLNGKGHFELLSIAYPLAWPRNSNGGLIAPTQISLYLNAASRSGGQSITGAEQIVSSPAARWECKLTLPAMDKGTLLTWRGFLSAMAGRFGTVLMPTFDAKRGPPDGTIVTAAATAIGSTSIVMTLAAGGPILPGHLFSIAGRLYAIGQVTPGAPGVSTVNFMPPLRASIADGVACEFVRPLATMRFASDTEGKLDLEAAIIAHPEVTLVEAFL